MFSIIIPTRDRPDYLAEAVASVLAQSHRDLELLIVNDGDGPIAGFGDARVRVLDNRRRGPVPARNLGVAEAKGTLIAFLDDDDIWIDPHHLSEAAKHLGEAGFVFADGIMRFPGEAKPRVFSLDASVESLERDNTILISACCYRRALHDSLGGFDEALPYYWDWDWYLRVARSGAGLRHISQPVVDIRIHPQNMSGDTNAAARRANLDAFEKKHGLRPIPLKNHADFVR